MKATGTPATLDLTPPNDRRRSVLTSFMLQISEAEGSPPVTFDALDEALTVLDRATETISANGLAVARACGFSRT